MGSHRKLRSWTHSGVKVFDNTAAPTSWTDLDLSSVVGKNRALVFLKIKNRSASVATQYHFRSKGDTEEVAFDYSFSGGNSLVHIDTTNIASVLIETNINGIFQWRTLEGQNTDIWILGYVK